MAARVVKVPDVGEGIAEVEVVEWHVKPGDEVAEDQPLATLMTDKASIEIPSPAAGRVAALGGEVGQLLAVGSMLVRFDDTAGGEAGMAERLPAAGGALADQLVEARTMPPPSARPRSEPAAPSVAPASTPRQDRPIASPAVRRRAWELGVDLKDVPPGGTAGRIVHADLDAYLARHGHRPPPAPAAAPRGAVAPRDDTEAVPVIGLRRRIAMKMQEAKRRIPHFSYVEEVDVTEVEALRAALNAKWEGERPRLTLLAFIARAIVLACAECPQLNARFDDEAGVVMRHGAVHLGVATQTAHGLMVPVLRHAEALDLWAIAREVMHLAEASRAGRVTRAELTGSTITLTSLGALGGIASTPVINHPEVAIVGVNRIVERPALRGGLVVPRLAMNLSSSFDHRVIDGIDAARFVQAIRGFLEQPATLFVG
ncbi:dihydrolipoamide acetyltransferase family protein [Azohydromonas caseinilytica]|uniref:Dihydrolipoamide acetyltransferase component of pyruvate dehydrogenase complex n=1 Tax=Azohydromonas caseinilytica TaxID=2728836 RepID=A0A848FCH4_9BURK|nr:dihydrolipoamide acetyltransferase family protein [Azohydromonas caseinilytica]NML17917.1 2-oxo acid dehydrogenase subunit E2 [Azohydromonas caseinilytica]